MLEEGVANHEFKTNQIVECHNGVFVQARCEAPYRLGAEILEWQGQQIAERTMQMRKWVKDGHPLTPYAYNEWLMQVQVHTHMLMLGPTFVKGWALKYLSGPHAGGDCQTSRTYGCGKRQQPVQGERHPVS